jgi:hypothetical protein
MSDIRYSRSPVAVGQVRYVGMGDGTMDVAAHVITALEPPVQVWDAELRAYFRSYVYRVRRATEAEERAHLALPADHPHMSGAIVD